MIILLIICIICGVFLSGCTSISPESLSPSPQKSVNPITEKSTGTSWMTIPLTEVSTGKEITIAELASKGKPVLMHTIAVWCPACSMQLRESTKLLKNNPDKYTVVAVDIDPRENADLLQRHKEKNEFEGNFVIAPEEFTRSLIDTMGTRIISSLPQTIVIQNQSVTYIGDGAFTEDKMKVIISELPS